MNKYYTPEIEEFHVGFEYEIFEDFDHYPKKEWHKQVYGKNGDDQEGLDYVSTPMDRFRVKHLDREDIESLGFTQEGQVSYKKNDWYIEWMPGDTLDVYCVSDCRFKGEVKNKSELKKVLKMIGV